jgi:hypothetical protein
MPLSSAQIVLPQVNDVYSLGDHLDLNFEVLESENVMGQISINLDCGNGTIPLYLSQVSLKANEAKKLSAAFEEYPLVKDGRCKIKAYLGGLGNFSDSAESKEFLVSKDLIISIKLNKERFRPEETLRIQGDVEKANGKRLDSGTVSITLNGASYSAIVKGGNFEFETTLGKTFPSGENEIMIEIKESSGNSGTVTKNISVEAIPSSIEIITDKSSFTPGESLKASAVLYDQGGKEMNSEISIILYDSWGLDIAKTLMNSSNESLKYTFDQKSPTGEWWLYAYSEGLKVRRFISVEPISKIDTNLNQSMLTVLNLGNIIFKKPLEIIFESGNETREEIKEVTLNVEGQEEYELTAPDGIYNITVKTENFEKVFNDVYLTGKAISIKDSENKTLDLARNIIALAAILSIIAGAVILKIKRNREKPISVRKITIKKS